MVKVDVGFALSEDEAVIDGADVSFPLIDDEPLMLKYPLAVRLRESDDAAEGEAIVVAEANALTVGAVADAQALARTDQLGAPLPVTIGVADESATLPVGATVSLLSAVMLLDAELDESEDKLVEDDDVLETLAVVVLVAMPLRCEVTEPVALNESTDVAETVGVAEGDERAVTEAATLPVTAVDSVFSAELESVDDGVADVMKDADALADTEVRDEVLAAAVGEGLKDNAVVGVRVAVEEAQAFEVGDERGEIEDRDVSLFTLDADLVASAEREAAALGVGNGVNELRALIDGEPVVDPELEGLGLGFELPLIALLVEPLPVAVASGVDELVGEPPPETLEKADVRADADTEPVVVKSPVASVLALALRMIDSEARGDALAEEDPETVARTVVTAVADTDGVTVDDNEPLALSEGENEDERDDKADLDVMGDREEETLTEGERDPLADTEDDAVADEQALRSEEAVSETVTRALKESLALADSVADADGEPLVTTDFVVTAEVEPLDVGLCVAVSVRDGEKEATIRDGFEEILGLGELLAAPDKDGDGEAERDERGVTDERLDIDGEAVALVLALTVVSAFVDVARPEGEASGPVRDASDDNVRLEETQAVEDANEVTVSIDDRDALDVFVGEDDARVESLAISEPLGEIIDEELRMDERV